MGMRDEIEVRSEKSKDETNKTGKHEKKAEATEPRGTTAEFQHQYHHHLDKSKLTASISFNNISCSGRRYNRSRVESERLSSPSPDGRLRALALSGKSRESSSAPVDAVVGEAAAMFSVGPC